MFKRMAQKVFALALVLALIALTPALTLAEGRGWSEPMPVQVSVTEPGGRMSSFPAMVRTDNPQGMPPSGTVELVYSEPATDLIANVYLDALNMLGMAGSASITWTGVPGTLNREGRYVISYTAKGKVLKCFVYIPGYDVPLSNSGEEGDSEMTRESAEEPTVVTIIETATEHVDMAQDEETPGEETSGEETPAETEGEPAPIDVPTPTDETEIVPEPEPTPMPEFDEEIAPEETPIPGMHQVQFYDANGELWMEMTVEEGAAIAKPDISGMTHAYAFSHWYQNSNPDLPYDFSQPVTSKLKLYAAMDQIPELLPEPDMDEEEDEEEELMPYVWINYQFNDNDTVTLFANADNLPIAKRIEYQWQNDASGEFQDVPGAQGPTFTFRTSDKDMFCNWRMRLTVSVQ